MTFPRSFLDHHFVRFMDAYTDGLLKEVYVDDFVMTPGDSREAARMWAITNDLDVETGDELLKEWRAFRVVIPPPIPDNIGLGES